MTGFSMYSLKYCNPIVQHDWLNTRHLFADISTMNGMRYQMRSEEACTLTVEEASRYLQTDTETGLDFQEVTYLIMYQIMFDHSQHVVLIVQKSDDFLGALYS